MGVKKMKQLINVLEKIHKELKVNNAIESCKLIINFKQSGFTSENDKMIKTQMPIILRQLSNINKSIYDN
jgi:uncharacterized protein YsxB (DUF464 family)